MEHSQTVERLVSTIPGMHARERGQRTEGPTPAPGGIENRDEEKHRVNEKTTKRMYWEIAWQMEGFPAQAESPAQVDANQCLRLLTGTEVFRAGSGPSVRRT